MCLEIAAHDRPERRRTKALLALDEIVEQASENAARRGEMKDMVHGSALALSRGQNNASATPGRSRSSQVLLMDEPASVLDPVAT